MTKKIYTLVISMILLTSTLARAQYESPQMPTYVFPSPLSQKMMKYGEQQPCLATGAVNVTIPLHTIQVNDYSLPLFLNYYSNGIKVEDVPHPIGYGWSLQPAFRITRTVMGRPDGYKYPLFNEKAEGIERRDFIYGKSALTLSQDAGERYGYPYEIDTRYDLFSVNLPHESFRFIIDKNTGGGWDATTDGSTCKVHFTPNEITVTDNEGIVYTFNVQETIYGAYDMDVTTTWGLKEIKLLGNKGKLTFNWSKADLYSFVFPAGNPVLVKDHCDTFTGNAVGDLDGALRLSWTSCGAAHNTISYKDNIQLMSIDTPQGKVTFNYHSDYQRRFLIQNIRITDIASTVVKEIGFEYNLYNLSKLSVPGEGSYSFRYNNPITFTTGMQPDYWGYYNGISTYGNKVPKVNILARDYGQHTSREYSFGCGNRTPSESSMKRNILESITYPTGGTTDFSYEIHRFDGRQVTNVFPAFKFTQGGGLRVSSIVSKASPTSPAETKRYKYGKNENGKGNSSIEPTPDTFINEQVRFSAGNSPQSTYNYSHRHLTIKGQSDAEEFMAYYPAVWYDEVTEYVNDDAKTVFNYEFPKLVNGGRELLSIHPNVSCGGCYNGLISFDNFGKLYTSYIAPGLSPNLIKKSAYKKEAGIYKKVFEQQILHYYQHHKSVNNVYVYQTAVSGYSNNLEEGHFRVSTINSESFHITHEFTCAVYGTRGYGFGKYRIDLGRNIVVSETNTYYDGDTENTQSVSYTYSKHNNKVLTKQTTNSTGGVTEEKYYYPLNLDSRQSGSSEYFPDKANLHSGVANSGRLLTNSNILSTPILMEWYQNGNLIGNKSVLFGSWGNNLVFPDIEYYATTNVSGEPRIKYHNYDQYGNPVYITLDSATKVVYLWSYKGQYPIAEIKNATYDEVNTAVKSVFSVTGINDLSATATPYGYEASLKNGNLQRALPNAHVTTYTYKPQVGILTMTNPLGITTHYSYDHWGRLTESYIMNGSSKEVLEGYKYKIVNE